MRRHASAIDCQWLFKQQSIDYREFKKSNELFALIAVAVCLAHFSSSFAASPKSIKTINQSISCISIFAAHFSVYICLYTYCHCRYAPSHVPHNPHIDGNGCAPFCTNDMSKWHYIRKIALLFWVLQNQWNSLIECLHLHDRSMSWTLVVSILFVLFYASLAIFLMLFCCRVCHFLLLQWPVSRFCLSYPLRLRVCVCLWNCSERIWWAKRIPDTTQDTSIKWIWNSGRIEVKRLNKSWGTIKVFGSANITHHFHLILLFWDACDDTANRTVKVKRISGNVCDKHPLGARIFNLIWFFCWSIGSWPWPFASRPN